MGYASQRANVMFFLAALGDILKSDRVGEALEAAAAAADAPDA